MGSSRRRAVRIRFLIQCAILRGTSIPVAHGQDAASDSFLHPRETALLGPRAVPKRRADFARGRWIAKRLIQSALAHNSAASIAILPNEDGVPVVHDASLRPLPVSLSISHCRDYAAAAVVDAPFRVGVDVEATLDQPGVISENYFTPSERLLCKHDGADFATRATAIWTLKEAALKVLGVGLRAPSMSVEVQGLDAATGDTGWVRTSVSTRVDGAAALRAWFRGVPGGVIALAVHPEVAGDPPAPLWFD